MTEGQTEENRGKPKKAEEAEEKAEESRGKPRKTEEKRFGLILFFGSFSKVFATKTQHFSDFPI